MKIKNVEIGGYIQSKKDSKQLIAGHCYQVVEKDVSDKTVRLFSVDDSFDDSLWFCVSDFRKQRPQPQPEPQLKQLDQSIFDGLDEKWRFAAVDEDGAVAVYLARPTCNHIQWYVEDKSAGITYRYFSNKKGYDASNWQNSLIERDIAKELLEVDLSSELTGSDYFYSNITSALLESSSKLVVCFVSNVSESDALDEKRIEVITSLDVEFNDTDDYGWQYAIPINNQGEPLTAAEVGL